MKDKTQSINNLLQKFSNDCKHYSLIQIIQIMQITYGTFTCDTVSIFLATLVALHFTPVSN